MPTEQNSVTINHVSYLNATGAIDYGFTNDYMFRAILQQNPKALKGLISSMLHLAPDEIVSTEIKNPIVLGQKVDNKEFVLDIHVLMNNNTHINLEMQVANQYNWSDRSLSYLCRTFDQLTKGNDYIAAKPAIHIGFLDFTPFPEVPEFYATYKLLNVKNYHLYSSKFILNMLDLSRIDLATKEDTAYGIDHWARLFKATTWEEIKMLTKNNEYLEEASQTLFEFNGDDTIRSQCLARMDYERMQRGIQHKLAEQEAALAEQATALTAHKAEIATKNEQIKEKDAQIATQNNQIEAQKDQIAKLIEENNKLRQNQTSIAP